jgi:hypothetical protein
MFKFKMEEVNGGTGGSGVAGPGGQVATANIADGAGANDPGAVQQPVGGSTGGAGAGGGDGKSWLEGLPDDVKGDPSLAVFKDVAGLAKSYVNAQKMIGADKVILPNDKSTEAEWNAFYQKLGRPDAADKYEIKGPDGKPVDNDIAKSFKSVAFEAGLSPKQVAKLAEWNAGVLAESQKAAEAQKGVALREALNAYQQELGGEEKYKANVDAARVAVRALAGPKLTKLMAETEFGSRPEVIEFFANLKGMMDEGKVRDGTGVPFSDEDPSVIQGKIDEIQTKIMANLNSPERMSWVEQQMKLRERLNAIRKPA